VPDEVYVFTLRAYDRLAKAAVNPLSVTDVLGQPVVRRHIGAALQVAGRDRDGAWLGVSLIETEDDQYEVVGARYLDEDEVVSIRRMREMGGDW
jgi:hypothetical protein